MKGVRIMPGGSGPMGSGYNQSPNQNQYGGYHHTLYDRNSNNHISWDTDRNGDYVDGTGHEDRDNQRVNDWPRDNYPGRDW